MHDATTPAITDAPLCVYCGREPGTTRDHVPPQSLFPLPKPSDLVTVACCETCRYSQSPDDEYFRNMIALRRDVSEYLSVIDTGPVGEQVRDKVHRALARPQHQRATETLMRSVRWVELRSPAGLLVGTAPTFNVDTRRLDRVIRRSLLGLYSHEAQKRLPSDYETVVYAVEGFEGADAPIRDAVLQLVRAALRGKLRTFGNGVFQYWVQGFVDVPHASLWLFRVYERVLFIGMTHPAKGGA